MLPGSYGGLVGVIFDCDREVLFSLIGSLVLRVEEDERSITAHSLNPNYSSIPLPCNGLLHFF